MALTEIREIPRGNSHQEEFEFLMPDGSPVDLNNVINLELYLRYNENYLLEKFDLNGAAGFEPITIEDAANGVGSFIIPAGTTKDGKTGQILELEWRAEITIDGQNVPVGTVIKTDLKLVESIAAKYTNI